MAEHHRQQLWSLSPQGVGIKVRDSGAEVRAPIDDLEMVVEGSVSPEYHVRITSGLPNGCTRFERTAWKRVGDTIRVEVLNKEPASKDMMCSMVYGTHVSEINLGSDFEPNKTYTIVVNGGARIVPFRSTGQ